MTTQSEVNKFLGALKKAINQRGISVIQREKNVNTMTELGFHNMDVQNEVLRLDSTDYIDGPKPDRDVPGEFFWEFGRIVEHEEIYIRDCYEKN